MKTGTLNGVMLRTTPFGSAFIFGLRAKKFRLNSALCDLVHFSTLSYAVRTSIATAAKSKLQADMG